jgi:head-tail adaptor
MSDAIGVLRARVTLQSPLRTPDDLGGAMLSWADEGDAWAEIKPASAKQGIAYDTAPSVGLYAAIINRRSDVRAGWRLLWGVRTLRITGVRDGGDARIELSCEEEVL